jgi:TPR repeat protein
MKKLITLVLLYTTIGLADINSAKDDYKNERFEQAYSEFKIIAQLGFSEPQNYLAQMLMKSQGVEKNLIEAYAWSLISEGELNDYNELTQIIHNKLNPEQQAKAELLAASYRNKYTNKKTKYLAIDQSDNSQSIQINQSKSKFFAPKYPKQMALKKQEGYVSFMFNIYPDGSVRDIVVEDEFPVGQFTKEAIKAMCHYNIAYKGEDGSQVKLNKPKPATQKIEFKLFKNHGSSKEQLKNIETVKNKALKGDAYAKLQYTKYFESVLGKTGDIKQQQINQWLIDAANEGYIEAHYRIGKKMFYGMGIIKQQQLGAQSILIAAVYGNKNAQYLMYQLLISNQIKSAFKSDAYYWLKNAVSNGSLIAKLAFVKYVALHDKINKKDLKNSQIYLKEYAVILARTPEWHQVNALLAARNKKYARALNAMSLAMTSASKAGWDLTELKNQRKLIKKHKPLY